MYKRKMCINYKIPKIMFFTKLCSSRDFENFCVKKSKGEKMKEKILYIVLAISIGINVGLFGVYIFLLVNRPRIENSPFHEKNFKQNFPRFENLKTIMDDVRELNEPYFEKLDDTKNEIIDVIKKDNPDTSLLDSFLREQAKTRYMIDRNLVFSIVKMKENLTEEEKEFLHEFFENRGIPKKVIKRRFIK